MPANPLAVQRSGVADSDGPYHCKMLSSQLDVAAMTHRGGRQENQDRFLLDSAHCLLMVADGVGGLKEGGLAAELACQSTHSNVLAGLPLESAVSESSAAIAEESTVRAVTGGMGSTIVAVQWSGSRFQLVWVGDSSARTYWAGCCYPLTRDHSEATEWSSRGIPAESGAAGHPRKHVLTQALGVTSAGELRIGRNEGILRFGEWLMLASDGVTNTLSAEEICALLTDAEDAEAATRAVMKKTLTKRPSDNVTLILARWSGSDGDLADLPRVYPD